MPATLDAELSLQLGIFMLGMVPSTFSVFDLDDGHVFYRLWVRIESRISRLPQRVSFLSLNLLATTRIPYRISENISTRHLSACDLLICSDQFSFIIPNLAVL